MSKHPDHDNSTQRIRWRSVALIASVLIVGALFAWWMAYRTDSELRENLLTQAHIAALAIDVESVETLTGTEADLNSSYYRYLKNQFADIVSVNSRYRFVYLLGRNSDGEVYFIVDNEPPDSKDCSPPGQIYEEATPELLSVFESKTMAVQGPAHDRWGVWVSAFVPLTDPQNGRLVAILGIDVDARTWRWMLIRAALLPSILTLALVAVLLIGSMLLARRKRAEDALSYQKDRYGFILESANVGTWEWNVQTGETVFNERWANIIGYTLKELSPVSVKTWEKYVHPDDLAASEQALEKHFSGEQDYYEIECRMKHKDGHWVWLIDRGKVISWTSDGKPQWMYGTHQDISERKQAEIALRESGAVLQSILDTTPAGVAIINNRRFILVNNSLCRLTGYSEEELLDQPTRLIYPDEDEFERIGKELYGMMEQTGLGIMEAPVRQKDGTCIDVLLCLTQLDPDNLAAGVCTTILDITELKRAEKKLREKTEELDRYFTSSLDLLCIADMGGHFIRLNPEWEKVLGYFLQELEGQLFLDFVHPDDLESTNTALSKLVIQEQVLSFENRYRCKDGSYRWIEWRAHPQGEMIYAAARDVTERKLAEEAIRESEKYLLSIFRSSPTGIGVVVNRIFKQVNERLCEITGYTPAELLEQDARMIYPSDKEYLDVGTEKYRQIREFGTGTVETRWLRKDGRIIDVLLSSTPILPDDQSKGVTFTALDITERKRVEEVLRLNESRLDTLVALGQMTSATLTELTDFTLENAIELTGSKIGYLAFMNEDESVLTMYSWSKTAMKQCKIINKPIIYPLETTGLWGECVRQRRPVITNDYHAPNPLKKGFPEGHVELSRHMNIPVFDGDRIVAVAGVGNKEFDYDDGDVRQLTLIMEGMWRIIERERVQEALRSERNLFSAGPVFTIVWEPAEGWPVRQVSENVTGILGYTPQELTSETFIYASIIHPEDLDRIAQEVTDYFKRGINSFEQSYRLKTKDGGYRWFYDFTKLTRDNDGNVATIRGYMFDQTRLKEAEQELKASEEKYRLLIDNSHDIIYSMDREGIFTYVSPAWTVLLGHAVDQVIGQPFARFLDPDDVPAGREYLAGMYKTEQHQEGIPYRVQHIDGSWRWHVSSIVPLRNENGEIIGVYGIARDITARKLAEEEKDRLEAQLQQVQKMESVGRLAGGVAHDFNNMLSVILGHTEMALDLVNPSETLYSDLEEIRKAAVRSADLTRQLLAFARKQTVTPKKLDLNDTVEGMLKMLKRLIGEDIELIWKPGDNLWSIRMDLSQIDQIMANLCINSRDAISGVGKVTIETQNCVFDDAYCDEHASFEPGEYVQLVISDTGCGMDRETLTHIFEPFFTTKNVGEGTGLGLATVYGVIKQNNGYINAYSELGIGTTFKIYIPRHKPMEESVKEKATTQQAERGNETILLVEDEATILRMTKRILELQGYTVISASTPSEAINLAKKHTTKIDLLITDVIMPEMNGRDLANNLLSIYPNLKRLFMSGYTANVIAHHGVLDDGVHFIQKPFTMKNLAAVVRNTLDQG